MSANRLCAFVCAVVSLLFVFSSCGGGKKSGGGFVDPTPNNPEKNIWFMAGASNNWVSGDEYDVVNNNEDLYSKYPNQVVIRWGEYPDAAGFVIERSESYDSGYTQIASPGSGDRYYIDRDLDHSIRYYYRIKVRLSSGAFTPYTQPFYGQAGLDKAGYTPSTQISSISPVSNQDTLKTHAFHNPRALALSPNGLELVLADFDDEDGGNNANADDGILSLNSTLGYNGGYLDKLYSNWLDLSPVAVAAGSTGVIYTLNEKVDDSNTFTLRRYERSTSLADIPSTYETGKWTYTPASSPYGGYYDRSAPPAWSGGAARFNKPNGLALYRDRYILVMDSGNFRVQLIRRLDDGTYRTLGWFGKDSQKTTGTWHDSRTGKVVDNVFVSDVSLLPGYGSADGCFGAINSSGTWIGPDGGIAVDRNGVVYVADSHNHRIMKFRLVIENESSVAAENFARMEYLGWLGRTAERGFRFYEPGTSYAPIAPTDRDSDYSNNGGFFRPWSVAVDQFGYLYVSDLNTVGGMEVQKIHKYNAAGSRRLLFNGAFSPTSTANWYFNRVVSVAGSGKNIYALDFNPGTSHRVIRFVQNSTATPSDPGADVLVATASTAGDGLDDRIRLKWLAYPGAERYHVYRSSSLAGPFLRASAPAGITELSFDDLTAVHGSKYYYRIEAVLSSGLSVYSTAITGSLGLSFREYEFSSNLTGGGSPVISFKSPIKVLASKDYRKIYALDSMLNRIFEINDDGSTANWDVLLSGAVPNLKSFAVDSSGNMAVLAQQSGKFTLSVLSPEHQVLALSATGVTPGDLGGAPTDVAIVNDRYILLMNSGTFRVQVLAYRINGITVDILNKGWLGYDAVNGGVWRASTSGAHGAVAVAGSQPGAFGGGQCMIAAGPEGAVYVSDPMNHRIQKFQFSYDEKDQTLWNDDVISFGALTSWGDASDDEGGFQSVRSVAVDRNGYVYTSDYAYNQANTDVVFARIQMFTASGDFIATFGMPGSAETGFAMQQCDSVAVGHNGSVYVTDKLSQTKRIAVFTVKE